MSTKNASFLSQPRLGFLLHDSARLLRKRFEQNARHLGLTRAQWQVLVTLARHEGASQSALADELEVEPITLCRIVDRLEQNELIERRADPRDRRAWKLFLRPKAYPLLDAMEPIVEATRAEALDGVCAEDRARLIEILELLRANLLACDDGGGRVGVKKVVGALK